MTTEQARMVNCGHQIRVYEGGGDNVEERKISTESDAIKKQNDANSEKESRLKQQQHYNDTATLILANKSDHFSDGDDENDDDEEDDDENDSDDDDQYEQAMDIFVKHFDHQQQQHSGNNSRVKNLSRRPSLPTTEDIELTTFSGVVVRGKHQLKMNNDYHDFNNDGNEQQQPLIKSSTSKSISPLSSKNSNSNNTNSNNRPLSISSISSAASSGSNVSTNSSSSSGIHSSLTRNGSLNYSQDFKRNFSYLQQSIESLNSIQLNHQQPNNNNHQQQQQQEECINESSQSSSSIIEQALKNLRLSNKDNNLAQTRAAILAAGQLQRRSFNIHQSSSCSTTSNNNGENFSKLSRINRSFHASLRYDKSTAYRIHLMANARAFGLGGQTKSYNLNNSTAATGQLFDNSLVSCEPRGIFRRYSTVSRNNSSTSSDSGHSSGSSGNSHLLSKCQCGANANAVLMKQNHLVRKLSEGNNQSSAAASDSSSSSTAKKLLHIKAATLDGSGNCGDAFARENINDHHPNCPSYSLSQSSSKQQQRPLRASPKLQQSPSSVSSYSNNSSLFRDDGFDEDDLTSTTSGHSSSIASSASSKNNNKTANNNYHNLRSSSCFAKQHQQLQLNNDTNQIKNTPTIISSNAIKNNNHYQQHQHHLHHDHHHHHLHHNHRQTIRIHNEQELPLLSICQRVVTEIIETERSYVDDLEQIVSGYLCRLRDILDQHQELFSNLEDIYKFNKDFLFQLEECYLNPGTIAACFVENATKFSVYTHYCTQYPQVVLTLTELMAQPTTAQLLKERQLELNQSLPLGAYLLKPVQRILKYHILFKSLIKHAADDETVNEKDLESINEAISVMTSIASHINEMKKRHEHSIRVQELQSLLCGWEGPDLTTLGELILEDTFKLFNRQKSSRHLLLFDNVLLITKKKHDGSLQYKGHIECSNLMLIEAIEGQPLVFNTVPFDNPKALCAFQANNLEKKRDWCLQMKEVIIKSFEVKIPVHVRDLLMSLTKTNTTITQTNGDSKLAGQSKKSSSEKAVRAPDYLEKKKRSKQQLQDKLNNSGKTTIKR